MNVETFLTHMSKNHESRTTQYFKLVKKKVSRFLTIIDFFFFLEFLLEMYWVRHFGRPGVTLNSVTYQIM